MRKWLLAVPVALFMAACTNGVLPTAPEAVLPEAPVAETQAMCNTIAANEKAIRSWLAWPDAFGINATGRVETFVQENDNLRKALETRGAICVIE